MKRSALAVSAALIAMSMVVVGCGSPKPAAPGAAASTGSGSEKPYYIEKPYPTITPESPNEKKASASTAQALATYITNAKAANKQNKRDDRIFDNAQGYKPRFVGYGYVIYSGKLADGRYRTLDVAAFDGGSQVKPLSAWERFGSAAKGDGMMNDSYYAGASIPSDPAQFNPAYVAVGAGEKAAQAAVEAWAKKNLTPDFSHVVLSTYLFQWGEREDRPNMMMSITPGGFSYNSIISWGAAQ
jgi:hypothetical protein